MTRVGTIAFGSLGATVPWAETYLGFDVSLPDFIKILVKIYGLDCPQDEGDSNVLAIQNDSSVPREL